MAKIVLSLDGRIVNQRFLDDARICIGSDADCALVVHAPEVGPRHAEIHRVVNDFFIEAAVPGTELMVNGKTAPRHLLQSGDVVFLGAYRLKYLNNASTRVGLDRTQLLDRETMEEIAAVVTPAPITLDTACAAAQAARERLPRARIRGLEGSYAGRELDIERVLLTVGAKGECLAVINRRPGGCFLTQVEGRTRARVNGTPIGTAPAALADGDLIEAAAERIEFHTADQPR